MCLASARQGWAAYVTVGRRTVGSARSRTQAFGRHRRRRSRRGRPLMFVYRRDSDAIGALDRRSSRGPPCWRTDGRCLGARVDVAQPLPVVPTQRELARPGPGPRLGGTLVNLSTAGGAGGGRSRWALAASMASMMVAKSGLAVASGLQAARRRSTRDCGASRRSHSATSGRAPFESAAANLTTFWPNSSYGACQWVGTGGFNVTKDA